jgi:hypothetical protein
MATPGAPAESPAAPVMSEGLVKVRNSIADVMCGFVRGGVLFVLDKPSTAAIIRAGMHSGT